MTISFPIAALWVQVKRMGAKERDYSLGEDSQPPLPPIVTSVGGIDVTLDEVDTPYGLLSCNGAQVVLYIPNQDKNIDKVLVNGASGKKFHIADCTTLEQMRLKNKFQKYRAVVNITGEFEVFGYSMSQGSDIEENANLRVCINCLKHLNYKGYVTSPKNGSRILKEFNLMDFFAENSTLFRYLPSSFIERKSGYSEDWKIISQEFRDSRSFTCESCNLNLDSYRQLLHAHHIDGNKRNNSSSNLMALCADCHRKQPLHDFMSVKAKDMALLQKLRREQGLTGSAADWSDLFELVDPPYQGLLRHYHKSGASRPEIGFEIFGKDEEVVAEVELSWPDAKFAVSGDKEGKIALESLGWRVVTLADALQEFRDKR